MYTENTMNAFICSSFIYEKLVFIGINYSDINSKPQGKEARKDMDVIVLNQEASFCRKESKRFKDNVQNKRKYPFEKD